MDLAEDRRLYCEMDKRPTREQILVEHIPHVKRIVERIVIHLPPSIDKEDLMQAGMIGLIEAMDRFDPERGNKFITYASYRIKGAILAELRSRDFLSRTTRKRVREMENAYVKLENQMGTEVTDQDVADEMGISLEQFYKVRAMANVSFIQFNRLDVGEGDGLDPFNCHLIDSDRMDISRTIGLKELFCGLASAIDLLPENEKLVVSLYYQDELTMKEIGQVMEITESRVSQIHSKAIVRLRKKLRMQNLIS
jgi:RNA polymerase sigma factor FliA